MKTTTSKIAAQWSGKSANLIRIPSAVLRRLAFTTVCMLAGLIAGHTPWLLAHGRR